MSNSYKSNIVHLSTGYIQFADPTKPWTPNDFPNLPSTSLSLGAQGRVEDGNINAISFTNAILYEPYEPQSLKSQLSKVLHINETGTVSYTDPKVGFVSTFSGPFQKDIRAFQPSTIGAAHILDVTDASPDTITNALGKLDAWIANAFLLQPPSVNAVESETNSLYGGVRWLNFNTYNVFDKFVPYIDRILLTIGDPSTAHYCTLSISDPSLFPYKNYKDGISPQQNPLVKLRIFSDFFLTSADRIFSKTDLASNGFRILNEYGDASLPSEGNVVAIQQTNAVSTYTTLSLYLPMLSNAYPKGSPVPIRVQYSNNTDGITNVALMSTVQTTIGGPSAPFVSTTNKGLSTLGYQLSTPIYSDLVSGITDPYISSYAVKYSLKQMAEANTVRNTGFRYGIANAQTIPASYSNITYEQSVPYTSSFQLTGTMANPLVPGAIWSTSVYAVNSGHLQGIQQSVPLLSTLFPSSDAAHISSVKLNVSTLPCLQQANSTLRTLNYTSGVWNIGNLAQTDVYYISSPTSLSYTISTPVMFNHPSYPGDQSTIGIQTLFNGNTSATLNMSTTNYDFPLNVLRTYTDGSNSISAIVSDTQLVSTFQKFFYKTAVDGKHVITSISPIDQKLQLALTHQTINGNLLTFSTPVYTFQTEPYNACSTSKITYKSCTSTTQICGIHSPAVNGSLVYELAGANFANTYANSNFGKGALYQNSAIIGNVSIYSTNKIYSGATEITTLPFPQNTVLTISSCAAMIGSNAYTNPLNPKSVAIGASVTPANPINQPSTLFSSITTMFLDTVSQKTIPIANGQRIRSLLPLATYTNSNAIGDGVLDGKIDIGLNVPISTVVTVNENNIFTVNPSIRYNHTSTLTTDTYRRELLFTNGMFQHPAGLNFSQYSGIPLGKPDAVYPDFTNDLSGDSNDGYRYASFAYESQTYSTPTAFQYLHIRVKNPSLVSSITASRSTNTFFPDWPMNQYYASSMMVRMHAKVIGAYNVGTAQSMETAWLNALKERDDYTYDDSEYDLGSCVQAALDGNDVVYTSQFNRRFFTKICPIVRIGISRDGAAGRPNPITFEGIQVSYSDSYVPVSC